MELQECIDLITQCAENNGWGVYATPDDRDGSVCFEFNTSTPCGQDFWITCYLADNDPHTLVQNVYDYWQSYDPDYEATFWIGDDGHGKNGDPYHIIDIVRDMEAAEKRIAELYDALSELDFDED